MLLVGTRIYQIKFDKTYGLQIGYGNYSRSEHSIFTMYLKTELYLKINQIDNKKCEAKKDK